MRLRRNETRAALMLAVMAATVVIGCSRRDDTAAGARPAEGATPSVDETKAIVSTAVQAGKEASQRERERHGPRHAVPLQRDAGHVQAETPTGAMGT